jgi:hypothetical protein
MGSEPKSLQDFYISSKEPDIGSVIVGMFLVCGFSAPFLFIALFSLFEFFFLEGTSMGVVFGISFLVIPFFLIRYTLRKFSTLRLRVNHYEDSIVVERAFQNKVWKRIRKSISEAQILAYHYYIITRSFETEKSIHGNSPISSVGPVIGHITVNEQSDSVHQKYHIHGYSGEGGNWKLEISKLIEGAGHDKAREIAKYIGIEFRDEGAVQPKGLVIG